MAKTQNTTAKSFAETYPAWKRANDRWIELSSRRNQIHDELSDLDHATTLENAIVNRPDRVREKDVILPPTRKRLSERVKQLLGDLAPAEPPLEPPDPQVIYHDPNTARCIELGVELRTIEESLEALHPHLVKAHRESSRDFCAAMLPAYRAEAAGPLVRAMIELGQALRQHSEWIRDIRLQGADVSFMRPMDTESDFGFFREALAWAATQGHTDPSQLPADWLASPAPVAPATPLPRPTPHTDAARARGARFIDPRGYARAAAAKVRAEAEASAAHIGRGC
jgi:hypothetical protein